MTTQKITLASIEANGNVRWTVVLDLPPDRLEQLFCLSLLDGEEFHSMRDAAAAVADAVARDTKSDAVRH